MLCAIVAALLLLGGPSYSRRHNTCALCRFGGFDYSCLGIPWSDYHETECTKWYREHIEPVHEHMWVSGSTEAQRNVFGTVISIADGDRRALFRLTPSQQVEIYKHIFDPKESKRIFLFLGSDKGSGDQSQRRCIYVAAGTLREWAESGFTATWTEIKPKIDAK